MKKLLLVSAVQQPLDDILRKGVTFNGYSQGKPVVLCQTIPFFLGVDTEWLDVWFVKAFNEVFIDVDEDVDFEFPELPSEQYLGKSLHELQVTKVGVYGLFVYNIKPNEILRIDHVKSIDIATERRTIWLATN